MSVSQSWAREAFEDTFERFLAIEHEQKKEFRSDSQN